MRDGPPLAIGPALANAVVLIVPGVQTPLVIRLEAVRRALLSEIHYCPGNLLLGGRPVAQERRRSGKEVPARQRTVVKRVAVCREGDTVGCDPERPRLPLASRRPAPTPDK